MALLVGCSGDPTGAAGVAGSFVARAAGTEALVAVVTNGTDVRAYVCDGTPTRQLTIGEWLEGSDGERRRPGVAERDLAPHRARHRRRRGRRAAVGGWIVTAEGDVRGSMPTPARTSLDAALDVAGGTAHLPGVGTVTPGKRTPPLTAQRFQGCVPGGTRCG